MRRLSLGFVFATALSVAAVAAAPADSRVADAAASGNLTAVRALIKAGADVNGAQGDGMTALHWAAMKDDVAMTQALVTAGASPKATTRLGDFTPIFFAAKNGNPVITRTLLVAGADVKTPTSLGLTPLMVAAAGGNAETITLLVDKGADVNAAEKITSETPLMFAAANNRADAIKVLIARGADWKASSKIVDIVKEQAAARAAGGGGRGAGGAAGGGGRGAGGRGGASAPPLVIDAATIAIVAQSGALPSDVKALQNPGAPAGGGRGGQGGGAPAGQGAGGGQAGGAQGGGGAQAAGDDSTPAPVDFMGGLTPLMFAARQGNMDAVVALVSAGADVNQVNPGDKSSPMLVATVNGKFDVAMYLLAHGGNPNLASTANAAPLYAALNVQWAPHAFYPQPSPAQQKTSHLELMEALLKAGANPNTRLSKKLWYTGYNFDQSGVDAKGTTAFWRATQAGDLPAMKLLVAHGADPKIASIAGNTRQPNGRTDNIPAAAPAAPGAPPAEVPGTNALLMATGAGYDGNFQVLSPLGFMPALKYLVEELHMDVNVLDAKGYSAVHYAAFRGDNDMINYLVSKGANPKVVAKDGMTTVDYANGPVQRLQPFPETIKLLEGLGAINNHKCKSC